jgi:small subunit ribosomal protein S16
MPRIGLCDEALGVTLVLVDVGLAGRISHLLKGPLPLQHPNPPSDDHSYAPRCSLFTLTHFFRSTTTLATKIRLMRFGKIRTPYYRIVVTDSRKARNGLSIEEIGRYVPGQEPSIIQVNSERAQYWLGVGAQPTEAVAALFKVTGDWQKFKGLPGTEGTLKVAAPKPAKSIAYEAAVKAAASEPAEGATTLKKKAQEKLAAKSAPAVEEAPVVEAVAEESPAVTEQITEEATEAGTPAEASAVESSDTAE